MVRDRTAAYGARMAAAGRIKGATDEHDARDRLDDELETLRRDQARAHLAKALKSAKDAKVPKKDIPAVPNNLAGYAETFDRVRQA